MIDELRRKHPYAPVDTAVLFWTGPDRSEFFGCSPRHSNCDHFGRPFETRGAYCLLWGFQILCKIKNSEKKIKILALISFATENCDDSLHSTFWQILPRTHTVAQIGFGSFLMRGGKLEAWQFFKSVQIWRFRERK